MLLLHGSTNYLSGVPMLVGPLLRTRFGIIQQFVIHGKIEHGILYSSNR